MNKEEIVLLVLSSSNGGSYSPVQIQKLFFLIDKNLGKKIGGPHFDFRPYHYGPFDKNLYFVINELERKKLIEIIPEQINRPRSFKLTSTGQAYGIGLLNKLKQNYKDYISKVDSFVRETSFQDLVLAIYKEYPEMKEKSIFAG